MLRRFINRRGKLLSIIIPLLLFGVIAGGHSQATGAAEGDVGVCQFYRDNLKVALDSCDPDKILALLEISEGTAYDCIKEWAKKAILKYYNQCFKVKLEQALSECNLELVLNEEDMVNTKFKAQPIYSLMREMLNHTKCIGFTQKCLKKTLKEAIARDDWFTIVKTEGIINSEALKVCPNHSRLTILVEEAWRDYFEQWIPKKLAQAIEKYNLEEIYRLETLVYRDKPGSPGFRQMRGEFLKIKCQNLGTILEHILGEAVADCDAEKILDNENLLLYKWRKNCLGYDYKALEASISQAKRSYLEGCLAPTLKAHINRCDLSRILKLEKMAHSIQALDLLQEISARKCFDLVECLGADLEYTIHTCNQERFQELRELLNSGVFNKCDNYKLLQNLLQQQQQAFAKICSSQKIEAIKAEFAQGVSPLGTDPAHYETEWINRVTSLIDKYKSSEQGQLPLEEINKIIYREFKNNILYPPLLNKNLTAAKRRAKFVSLIKAMRNIQKRLEYDGYLDSILAILTTEIFGIQKDKNKVLLSASRLEWIENLFKGMDKELREAVFEVDDPQVSYKFYTKFYFPLIKVNKLLDSIYEYEGQRPFEYFIDKLDKDKLEASFKELVKFLAEQDFINAEAHLSKLLTHYYYKRGKNIWEYPDIILSKNINIPVFINILKVHEGRLKEVYKFDAILNKLLTYIDNKKYLIKGEDYNARKITYYDSMSFFDFIYYELLIPWEIKEFYLKDKYGNPISIDKLINEENKILMDSEADVTSRRKVEGRLRQIFYDKIFHFNLLQILGPQTQMSTGFLLKKMRQQLQDYLKKKVSTAIFLPNSSHNNAGDDLDLEEYNKIKRELSLNLKSHLADAQTSSEITDILIFILRLNKSYRSGELQLPFYIITDDIYRNYFNRLEESEKWKVILERLKLGLSHKRLADKDSLKIFLSNIKTTNNDLTRIYRIKAPDIKTISDSITFRLTSANTNEAIKQIKDIKEEKIIFFLMRNLGNLLHILNNEKELALNDAKDAYQFVNNILDIYNHRLPFLSNVNPASIANNKNALALLILLTNDDIKHPFVVFNDKFVNQEKVFLDKSIRDSRSKIISKLIVHNFLNWEVVFDAIESDNYEIFNMERELKYKLLDFDLLISIIEEKKLSAHKLIEETFASFASNVALFRGVDDELIHQYFFGSAVHNLASKHKKRIQNIKNGTRINCFDDAIRKALKVKLGNLSPHIGAKIDKFIHDQTEAFSEAYNKFNSVFGIQKLWEMILANLDYEKSNQDISFFKKYQDFYLKGNFVREDAQDLEFREDIIKEFNKKFYKDYNEERELGKYLSNYFRLCSGEEQGNLGIKGVIDKYKVSNLNYIKAYRNAVVNLMPQVFEGKGLGPGQGYIGQMLYDNQQHKIKPIVGADLYSDDFYRMYDWIWECAQKSAGYPEIRRLFVEDKIWNKISAAKQQKYVSLF